MNLKTPKELFASGPHAKAWLDLTEKEMWTLAIHAAIGQMSFGQTGTDPGFTLKLEGAKLFAVNLTNLVDAPTKAKPPVKKINHSV